MDGEGEGETTSRGGEALGDIDRRELGMGGKCIEDGHEGREGEGFARMTI